MMAETVGVEPTYPPSEEGAFSRYAKSQQGGWGGGICIPSNRVKADGADCYTTPQ